MRGLDINARSIKKRLVKFIEDELYKRDFERGVMGLSGGVDSAAVAMLAAKALDPKNLTCLFMPYYHDEKTAGEVKDFVSRIRANLRIVDISPMVDVYFGEATDVSQIRRGNKMARERMSILYDQSKVLDALVLGTGNKTELMLGYFTLYGDSGCAISPIGSLYKTQVWQLARSLRVPKEITVKRPSAGLWQGQTDEDEMGFSYEEVDRLLFYMIDRRFSTRRLKRMGFFEEFINKVKARIKSTEFKRQLPAVPKI